MPAQPKVKAPSKGVDPRQFTAADVAAMAERLERNEYPNLFDCLEDWRLLQAVAFYSPKLVAPYAYLLEWGEVDED
ncbi:DUF2555 domain-containing protein [Synechococcus sp. O70.1]|uniref:DUF2555 domain-containing protein n=1 Tax=Synechococcus sp. O70.1 TaxID=2964535 RepID=UPI0039C3633B